MSVSIFSIHIADPDTRELVRKAIERGFRGVVEHWEVSIVESPDSDQWEVRTTSPQGEMESNKLNGTDGECTPVGVERYLRQLVGTG